MRDDDLLHEFEACTLPFETWTHRTHVKVAYLYLRRHDLAGAIDRMRAGIKAYNAANDVPEGPLQGYNETTTVAFMHLVHVTIAEYERAFPTDSADAFCDTHGHLLHPKVLRLYYSPELRITPEAKTSFVAPDLAPLPRPLS